MQSRLDEVTLLERQITTMLVGFALTSLVIAALGQYAAAMFNMRRRTRDFGVRMALGASATDVLKLVLRKGMTLALIGVVLGLAGAVGATRLLSTMLFAVKPTDLATFLIVSVGLIFVALLACYVPARRAMKVDPLVALRDE